MLLPPVITSPSRAAAVAETFSTRELPAASMVMSAVPLPSTSPSIVRPCVTASSPPVRTSVPPSREGSKVMVSPVDDAAMVPRREPAPPSFRFVTTSVLIPSPALRRHPSSRKLLLRIAPMSFLHHYHAEGVSTFCINRNIQGTLQLGVETVARLPGRLRRDRL